MFKNIVLCNDIDTDKYRKVLIDLGYKFNNFDTDEVNDEKFDVLISSEILDMNLESLGFVRNYYKGHLFQFIEKHLDIYVSIQTTAVFVIDEVLEIIKWDIPNEKKFELLSHTGEPISIVDKQFSDEVNEYILTHNLYEEDISQLFSKYNTYAVKTRNRIVSLSKGYISYIINNGWQISDDLISIILNSDDVIRENKIQIFIQSIPRLNEETCQKHFNELGLSELCGIFSRSGGRRKYTITEEVTTIFNALQDNNWIHTYSVDERNNEKYTVVKNKT